MKFKVFKVLTVCLVTLGVLAPALATFGIILKQNISTPDVLPLVYELKNSSQGYNNSTLTQETIWSQKETESLESCTASLPRQLLPTAQEDPLKFIFFILPLGICLGIFLYDRYYVYRTTVLKEQVEMLERLWQQSVRY